VTFAVLSGFGIVVVWVVASAVAPLSGAGAWYAFTAAVTFAGMMGVAARVRTHAHPFARLGSANVVTTVRAGGVALAAALIGEPPSAAVAWLAVGLGSTVAFLDGVDGWLARRTGMASPFGARFDMEVDALLMLVLSALVWRHDKAGAWILAGGGLRYAFGAAGWCWPWLAAPLTPTWRGKAIAVSFTVGLLVALAPVIARSLSAPAVALALTVLAWSFAVDIGRLASARTREGIS
jgi:phosphatidylglycerophosphate synthase